MATTPLIKTPQAQGGTFYTFSSAARDLSRTLNNDNLRLVFSKFVLLNLPDFDRLNFNSFSSKQNFMQFDTIDGMINNGGLKADPNVNFTESFQNYALNIEELIISDTNYDNTTNKSVSERVFFKWLKETGAIRFRNATSLEQSGTATGQLFTEEDEITTGTQQYRRVVKYIGDIDVVNNVELAGESYTEVYINVPTEVGGTPTILFESLSDENYSANLKIQGSSEFIAGRNASSSHPQGLSMNAFYDYDEALQGPGPAGYTDPNANWMNEQTPPTVTDAYFTEPFALNDPTTVEIRKYPADYGSPAGFTGVAYLRSRLDGISVDFKSNDYQQITSDPTISTISQFNGTDLSSNFEFNSVLVYYDMVDVNDSSNNTTNLYGLLLLDNITPTTDGGFIERSPKFKPNAATGQNGNSFGFKLNLRFDAAPGTSGVDTIINDYNTFSMQLFSEATAQLQESARIFQDQQVTLNGLETRVTGLENTLDGISDATSLQSQINSLQNQFNQTGIALQNSSTLLDLIAKNADEIQNLANGTVSTTLQYNTSVLRQGSGITLDKTVPNQITFSSNVQQYKFMSPVDENGTEITASAPLNINVAIPKVFVELATYTNMLRLPVENTAGGDLLIYIDDLATQFKTGQVVRLVFTTDLDTSRNIRVFTDSSNRLGTGVYGKEIANITSSDLSTRPIIEFICLEQGVLNFTFDIIK
tara:strand:+ start:6053 stop:8164 length:2112 start_codon:yes stop_codon:yes gene_type:complete